MGHGVRMVQGLSWTLGAALFLLACGGAAPRPDPPGEHEPWLGIPVPNPLPVAPDSTLIRFTALGPGMDTVDIVGLLGAVAGGGEVTLVSSRGTVQTRSTEGGSFVASVEVSGEETISVRFETSAWTSISVEREHPRPLGPPPDIGGAKVVSVDGLASFDIVVPPGSAIVVANPSNGAVVAEVAPEEGSLTVRIAAESGDRVRVYVDRPPLSTPLEVPVH
jgi:hypothetical protein